MKVTVRQVIVRVDETNHLIQLDALLCYSSSFIMADKAKVTSTFLPSVCRGDGVRSPLVSQESIHAAILEEMTRGLHPTRLCCRHRLSRCSSCKRWVQAPRNCPANPARKVDVLDSSARHHRCHHLLAFGGHLSPSRAGGLCVCSSCLLRFFWSSS